MIYFIIGFAAAMFMILAFCLGVSVTEKIYTAAGMGKPKAVSEKEAGEQKALAPITPAMPDAEKKHRFEAEQKAFDDCMKYNIDQAYDVLKRCD